MAKNKRAKEFRKNQLFLDTVNSDYIVMALIRKDINAFFVFAVVYAHVKNLKLT